ncbi:hypothetical protein BH09PLA1_BH09PLA1_32390 [soil metagenome]
MPRTSRAAVALLLTVTLSGCIASTPDSSPGPDHPANPDATSVASPRISDTLKIEPGTAPATAPASPPASAPMEGGHHHGH